MDTVLTGKGKHSTGSMKPETRNFVGINTLWTLPYCDKNRLGRKSMLKSQGA